MSVIVARDIEELLIVPGSAVTLLSRMDRLAEARDGWVNLVPEVHEPDEEDEDGQVERRSVFSLLFGGTTPPKVPLCTWVPARRRDVGAAVGIAHSRGRGAIAQLRESGVVVPERWRVEQDHPRRGLVVRADPAAETAAVLLWACQAGAALCPMETTGSWRATVHLPASGNSPGGSHRYIT